MKCETRIVIPVGINDIGQYIPDILKSPDMLSSAMSFVDAVIYSIPSYRDCFENNNFIYYDYFQDKLFQNFTLDIVNTHYDDFLNSASAISDIYLPWMEGVFTQSSIGHFEFCLLIKLTPYHSHIEFFPYP